MSTFSTNRIVCVAPTKLKVRVCVPAFNAIWIAKSNYDLSDASSNVNIRAARGTLKQNLVGAYINAGFTRPGTISGFSMLASQ